MDYNGEITVNPDAPYTSIDSVTVKVNVPLGKELYAWKHSSDVIYTKTLPKKSGTIEIVKLPLANDTGTYTTAEPEKTVSIARPISIRNTMVTISVSLHIVLLTVGHSSKPSTD